MCLDGFMNIAMEQAEEWSDGLLRQKYGDCFIRGNNGAWTSSFPDRETPHLATNPPAQCSMCPQSGEREPLHRLLRLQAPDCLGINTLTRCQLWDGLDCADPWSWRPLTPSFAHGMPVNVCFGTPFESMSRQMLGKPCRQPLQHTQHKLHNARSMLKLSQQALPRRFRALYTAGHEK